MSDIPSPWGEVLEKAKAKAKNYLIKKAKELIAQGTKELIKKGKETIKQAVAKKFKNGKAGNPVKKCLGTNCPKSLKKIKRRVVLI